MIIDKDSGLTLAPEGVFDILFVNAPHFNWLYPPSGIAYLCEAVRNAGFKPGVVDINNALICRYRNNHVERFWHVERSVEYWMGEDYSEIEEVFGADFDEAADALAETDTLVIGFSVNMLNLRTTDQIAARIRLKAPEKVIIYGGYSCYHDEVCRTLSEQPDYICVGESEDTIGRLMTALIKGGDAGAIPGVMEARKGSGRYVPSTRRENLDELAWPTWREFELSRYQTLQPFTTVSVNASRGCAWGRCHFCSDFNATPGFRRRSAESLLDEIRYSVENSGVANFHLSDLIVNGDHIELERFADLVIASGLTICFSGQFHIDKRLTPALLAKLKKAGMPIINFGMETGSNRMMKLMRKGHNVALAERCLKDAKETGLVTDINLLVGFPGETIEDIDETVGFLRRNRPYVDIVEVVNICSIQYGSPLWELRERFGVVFDVKPGVREVRDWVSEDGSNTFEERARRAGILKDLIKELGIGKGYHSQEFNFISSGDSSFDPKFYRRNLIDQLSDDGPLGLAAKILVLRSCGIEQSKTLLETLAKTLPGTTIDLLCQEDIAERLAPLCRRGTVHSYGGGPLSPENIPDETVERLQLTDYDAVVLPYGMMPKHTYNNVARLAEEVGAQAVVNISVNGMIELSEAERHRAER